MRTQESTTNTNEKMAATQPFQPRELTEEQKAKLLKAEQKVDKCEAELEFWSNVVKKATVGSEERKEALAQQALFLGRVDNAQTQLKELKLEFGQVPVLRRDEQPVHVVSLEDAFQSVLSSVDWKDKVTDFEPKLWEPSSATGPELTAAVRDAQVYGSFRDRNKPDFLLTEMMRTLRGEPDSTELAMYQYQPSADEPITFSRQIKHDELLMYDTVILIGTSGAGKTATSLRLAAKEFTVLLVCDPKGNGGSSDLREIIAGAEKVYQESEKNVLLVEDYVLANLAKLLWFRMRMLKECRLRFPELEPLHWAMAQLYPAQIFGSDVFQVFRHTSTEKLNALPALDGVFQWIVLDEVQVVDSKLSGAFRSKTPGKVARRSLLAPFTLHISPLRLKKLLCGTGLSASSVTETRVSPIKTSARTVVVGVSTSFDKETVDNVLERWGIPRGIGATIEERSNACALFTGRPRHVDYLASEIISSDGKIPGQAALRLKEYYTDALFKLRGKAPKAPGNRSKPDPGDDLFSLLRDAALDFVLGHQGVVLMGGLLAVQYGVCSLAPCNPRKRQRYDGNSVIAEPLVIRAFAEPMVEVFERLLLKEKTDSGIGYALEDYLALRCDSILSAVRIAATKGTSELNLPCHNFARDWRYRGGEYFPQIVERFVGPGEEMTILQKWLDLKRSGVIMPVTDHGADLIVLAWSQDVPLVVLVQSKSGRAPSTPEALLTLQLPYTTNRTKDSVITSELGTKWEKFLTDRRMLVAQVVFKPLNGSQRKPVAWEKERLIIILDKNSCSELATGLRLGIENLSKFKDSSAASSLSSTASRS